MQCNCKNNMACILRDFIEFLVQNTPKLAILGCFGPFLDTQNFEIGLKHVLSMRCNCTNNMTHLYWDFMQLLAQSTPK